MKKGKRKNKINTSTGVKTNIPNRLEEINHNYVQKSSKKSLNRNMTKQQSFQINASKSINASQLTQPKRKNQNG